MTPTLIVALLGTGALTGFLAGLLGIGGGMVMVPIISMFLWALDFPAEHVVRVAIATSLTTILFTSMSSVRSHHLRGAVIWPVVRLLAPGVFVGSLLGAQVAGAIDARVLATLFAIFVSATATQMLIKRHVPSPSAVPKHSMPGAPGMFGTGSLIGVLSALVGAGGGFLMVPFLSSRGVRIQNAVATSAACGFPIAFAGAVGYTIAGWRADLPGPMLGYIYLPALAFIAVTSMLTAPYGARAAHAMPTAALRKVFAFTLYLVAAYMLVKSLQQG